MITKQKHNIAIAAIWYERYLECSRTCMTTEFAKSVWRFYYSLLNIDEEDELLAIQNRVKEYVEETWLPKINGLVEENTSNTNDPDTIRVEHQLIEAQYIHEVFDKIKDVIQKSGIGWIAPSWGDAEASDYDEAMQG